MGVWGFISDRVFGAASIHVSSPMGLCPTYLTVHSYMVFLAGSILATQWWNSTFKCMKQCSRKLCGAISGSVVEMTFMWLVPYRISQNTHLSSHIQLECSLFDEGCPQVPGPGVCFHPKMTSDDRCPNTDSATCCLAQPPHHPPLTSNHYPQILTRHLYFCQEGVFGATSLWVSGMRGTCSLLHLRNEPLGTQRDTEVQHLLSNRTLVTMPGLLQFLSDTVLTATGFSITITLLGTWDLLTYTTLTNSSPGHCYPSQCADCKAESDRHVQSHTGW